MNKVSAILLVSLLGNFVQAESSTTKSKSRWPAQTTATSSVTPSSTAAGSTATGTNIFSAPAVKADVKALIATDFVGLTKGNSNAEAQFFVSEYIAPQINVSSSSAEEKRKKLNNSKVTVVRNHVGIGATGYLLGTKSNKNLFLGVNLLFGQESDILFVENTSGLELRLGGQIRPLNKISLDGGIVGNTLTGELKSEAFVRIGVLL